MRWIAVVAAVGAALLVAPRAAMAWKPFTHNYVGDQAYNDAVNDGQVTIGAHSYKLDSRLLSALRLNRGAYNAGVVGPDGFPDLVYGQSLIHPDHTGKWLRYLVDKAWAAQSGKEYTGLEKGQILAFVYGFLTHAAGDMWGHTLINDFAGGLFPAAKDFDEPAKAKVAARIALRHVIAEGYVGSATPGWRPVPDRIGRARVCARAETYPTRCDDISDDQTPGIDYNAPWRFIYNTLIDPNVPLPVDPCGDGIDEDHDGTPDDGCPGKHYTVGTPEPQRGLMVDYFLNREASLQIELARYDYDARHTDCNTLDRNCKEVTDHVAISTVRGIKRLTLHSTRCTARVSCLVSTDAVADVFDHPAAAYLRTWIEDIRTGLRRWGQFSLAITQALFNPQARRDAQNYDCEGHGKDTSAERGTCEAHVGALDTIDFTTGHYVNDYLLPMLGLPHAFGTIRKGLGDAAHAIDVYIGPYLNPFRAAADAIKRQIAAFVNDKVREATGIDVDQLRSFLEKPSRWMCGEDAHVSVSLPFVGRLTGTSVGLFTPADHQRLDALMGMPANHHEPARDGVSNECQAVRTHFNPNRFAAMKDSVTQSKLLLLSGTQLDRALGDSLADAGIIKSPTLIHTYRADTDTVHDNIMFTALGSSLPWLELIDGDHAWRQNGLPSFCDGQRTCPSPSGQPVAKPRPTTESTGGTGRYPLWESCVLRPAFRALFTDWENAANREQPNFPDLGDATSPDPANDPKPPDVSAVLSRGQIGSVGGVPTVTPGASFTASAHDLVFTDAAIKVSYRTYPAGSPPGPLQPIANGGSFPLAPGTLVGDWVVEVTATDACASRSTTQKVRIL
jgi:hypothetical protein